MRYTGRLEKAIMVPIKKEKGHYRPVVFYLQKNTVKGSQIIPNYIQDSMEMSNSLHRLSRTTCKSVYVTSATW